MLDELEDDHVDHSITATAFLTDLGATELARITEQFAASLTTQLQQLTNDGLYNASRASDITQRNLRDRDEQIQALNDRLNREQWENQHRIYEQEVAMRRNRLDGKDKVHGVEQGVIQSHVGQITSRFGLQQSARDRTMAGEDRLHAVRQEIYRYQAAQIVGLHQLQEGLRDRTLNGKTTLYGLREANSRLNIQTETQLYEAGQTLRQLLIQEAGRLQQLQQAITSWETSQRDTLLQQIQQIALQRSEGIEKQHAAQQDISRVAMGERERLLGMLNDAVKGIITGKERYSSLTMQQASTLAEHKHKVIVEKMNESATRLSGLQQKHAENMELMKYFLSERNQLLIGLYGFVERREDTYPSFENMVQLTTGLGDAGGGWVTP